MSSAFGTETVLDVRHWTDAYFSFTTTRDDGFRFDNGQFVMIGLQVPQADGSTKPLLRAYSIASANWEEQLEFFSIKVQNGPLTSRLKDIKPGDTVVVPLDTERMPALPFWQAVTQIVYNLAISAAAVNSFGQ